MNKTDKIIQHLTPLILVVAAVLVIAFLIDSIKSITRDNNVYVRYVACALSVDPEKRDSAVIKDCWDHVIKDANRKVHRYDDNNYPEHFWFREQ